MNWQEAKKLQDNKYEIPSEWLKIEYFEAFNILFRIENSLRVFVYIILKNEYQDKWLNLSITSDDVEASTLGAIAKKRYAQDNNHAYLGYVLNCPLLHLTSGEIIRIITSDSYWKLFKKYFLGSRDIIKNKLDEISNVRNSLAHFRPIKKGDIELIKQNSMHTLSVIEKTIYDFISCPDIVPSNTEDIWFKELKALRTEECAFGFTQSKEGEWIGLHLNFNCEIVDFKKSTSYQKIDLINMKTDGLLKHYPGILKYVISIAETPPNLFSKDPSIDKHKKFIHFKFSRKNLEKDLNEVIKELSAIMTQISKEVSLIKADNLARGKLIEIVKCFLTKPEESDYFRTDNTDFKTSIDQELPVEFWGLSDSPYVHFITKTNKYPWMPVEVSDDEDDLPF